MHPYTRLDQIKYYDLQRQKKTTEPYLYLWLIVNSVDVP